MNYKDLLRRKKLVARIIILILVFFILKHIYNIVTIEEVRLNYEMCDKYPNELCKIFLMNLNFF